MFLHFQELIWSAIYSCLVGQGLRIIFYQHKNSCDLLQEVVEIRILTRHLTWKHEQ